MSKKRIEKLIPEVMKVLHQEFPEGVIPSAYNGYISSFGASIMQSGLLPTLALFEKKDAPTKEDKSKLTSIIAKVLDVKGNITLLEWVLNSKEDQKYLKEQILDISVAIKLSIRTFKLDKGNKDE
jgi:CRISPR-associated protein Cmr5